MSALVYLSEPWIKAADSALEGLVPHPDAGAIGYRVTNVPAEVSPAGETTYTLYLGPTETGVRAGLREADVTLILGYDTAVAIAQHQLSAQRGFLDGSMRIDGDITVLLASSEQAKNADRLLSDLDAVILKPSIQETAIEP